MAEEVQYASRTENKRKLDDPDPAPAARRQTGFSGPTAPPAAAAAPPLDGFELAKQRAQEIASRLFTSAEAKRPKVENGDGADDSKDWGFSSAPPDYPQKSTKALPSQGGTAALSSFPSYGYQGSSKRIDIPNGRVGAIIGKGGETIRYLQLQSGAKIQVTRDADADPTSQTRPVELVGTSEQITKAEQMISDVLAEADAAGGSGTTGARKQGVPQGDTEQFTMKIPNNKVGLVIGKGGETIKSMQAKSGARIQLIPLHPPPDYALPERTMQIDGTKDQIEYAKQLVNEVISENRIRNPNMSGGYSQQGYRSSQPTASWVPPMQQPGYGYMQPGAYPGAPSPYNMSQPPYGGYPPPPVSGGFASGWDQSSNPASQQSTPGSGYDYYNQQQSQPQPQQPQPGGSTPLDNTSYNYGQQPATYNSQGSYDDSTNPQVASGHQNYGQDGYSSSYQAPSQPGYPQPVSSHPGYDQQQGYSTVPAYGAAANPTQDGSAPAYAAQGAQVSSAQSVAPTAQSSAAQQYASQQSATTTASYPSQVTTHVAYGGTSQVAYGSQPPAQTAYVQPVPLAQPSYGQSSQGQMPAQAAYGQGQQTPTAQSGYMQPSPVQAGYAQAQPPSAQSGFVQDPAQLHPPPNSGFAPGLGYGQQQPYGGAAPQT